MIMSSKKSEPGYGEFNQIWNSGKKIEVYVDGIKQNKCFYFDDVRGIAKIYPPVKNGIRLRDDQGDLLTETINGKIEIKIVER